MNNRIKSSIILLFTVFILFGCVSSPKYTSHPARGGRWQRGSEKVLKSVIGEASFYGKKFHGRKTANGETYNMWALTAAHKEYPFGTKIRVTNLSNNKSIIVRINDRGPFVGDRIIDLSRGAADKIGMIDEGVGRVRLDILEWGGK